MTLATQATMTKKESEAAQNHGIEQKPDVPTIPSVVESVPEESEGVESPDTASGQPEPAEVPPTADPLPLDDDPPKVSPNKSFAYLHGPTILNYNPERRSDWHRPDGWKPTEWAGVSQGVRDAIYEEWKAHEPAAVQKAYDLAQAYDAKKEERRAAKAKAEEERRIAKEKKLNAKKGGAPTGASTSNFDKRIVHFCPEGNSFLTKLMGSHCDVRPIHAISILRSLKHAYHELGEVSHSTMFWLSLPKESLSDDTFWKNLRKLFRCVQKGSGRLVFHMPRKSQSRRDAGVKAVLESYGLYIEELWATTEHASL